MTQTTAAGAEAMVRGAACARPIREVILHHTWAPTAAQYRGRETVEAIRRVHMSPPAEGGPSDGPWRDIGYHYLIGPDGAIFAGRPLAIDGAHVKGHNTGTVGVSLILNGDTEDPTVAQAEAAGALLRALCRRFGLDAAKNFGPRTGFHRDYSAKSCPGKRVTKAGVIGWVTGGKVEPTAGQNPRQRLAAVYKEATGDPVVTAALNRFRRDPAVAKFIEQYG